MNVEEILNSKIINKKTFSETVEKRVGKSVDTYLEGCLEVANELEIDEEDIPKYISEELKELIKLEGIERNNVKSDSNAVKLDT